MKSKSAAGLLLCFLVSCTHNQSTEISKSPLSILPAKNENPYKKIADIPLPGGYTRIKGDSNSFENWLRAIDLKKDKLVHKYDGTLKTNQLAQFAVMNISVGDKDLQQCADAVMRLRAEYLFSQKQFSKISFADNDGKVYLFTQPYTRANFDLYLNRVFGMCGTASLSKQLKTVSMDELVTGDVFVRGGFPGHAVIVVDIAENKAGKKIYMLAQSYMPAQEIHILNNPSDSQLSPWYELNSDEEIRTPEYTFNKNELKCW